MNPLRLLRELKGAPLAVIMALAFANNRRVTAAWLCSITGYTDKPITQALTYLSETGLVTHNVNGWTLTPSGRAFQPAQMMMDLPPKQDEPPSEPARLAMANPPAASPDQPARDPTANSGGSPDRNNSDPPIIIIDSESSNKDSESIITTTPPEYFRPQPEVDVARQALFEQGIMGAKLNQLSQDRYCTPWLIACWVAHLNKTAPNRWRAGMLIRCIESPDYPPGYNPDLDNRLTVPRKDWLGEYVLEEDPPE